MIYLNDKCHTGRLIDIEIIYTIIVQLAAHLHKVEK